MTLDPVQSARSAGLRYVTDDRPGITRRMGRLGFEYHRQGRRIRRAAELKRIAKLAIPPAWTDVWICPDPRGHLQATGRDARGRKQYRYHPDWRATRDETKYDRMLEFAAALPRIRTRTAADLTKPGLTREKVLATVVQLLERSGIRVGNEEYVKANGSFGLTTLQDKHVAVRGSTLRFEFRGKSGKRHSISVDDRRLAKIVKHCRDLPGQELFQYIDDGHRRKVDSGDVNDYLREVTGEIFTAKDFRTWSGTVLACAAFRELCSSPEARADRSSKRPAAAHRSPSKAALNRNVLQAVDAVAGVLGNTRTVCRKSYIHPAVIESYVDGTLPGICQRYWTSASRKERSGLSADEAAVLALLRRVSRDSRKKAA
jgi:DNA topoisomerase-1